VSALSWKYGFSPEQEFSFGTHFLAVSPVPTADNGGHVLTHFPVAVTFLSPQTGVWHCFLVSSVKVYISHVLTHVEPSGFINLLST
jgi:hypothetical protein